VRELAGRVAVVTGAASGIGRALALAFARESMSVALADLDADRLARVADEVGALGARSLVQRTDVARAADVDALAEAVRRVFGGAHVVCNNAGVAPVGPVWETPLSEWEWAVGANLWGVVHGVRAFVPDLIARDDGHVVNTASVAGLVAPAGFGAYAATKHAVVALSESLHHDLRERGSRVGVSVLCPAYVPTGLAEAALRRPRAAGEAPRSEATRAHEAMFARAVGAGKLTADDVAAAVVAAIRAGRFYILPHPRIKDAIRARMDDILGEGTPRDPMRL